MFSVQFIITDPYRKCMNRDVVVQGNPRVYKQLKINLEMVLSELKRIENGAKIDAELLETIRLINTTLYGLKGECE